MNIIFFFIIGGGSAGCNALYQLGKRGVNAVLLDKHKLISGTTWHTAGLVWSLRGVCDVEIELLKVSRQLYASLQEETNINPGWINNGGLLIAHSPVGLNISVHFFVISLPLSLTVYLFGGIKYPSRFTGTSGRVRETTYCPQEF